MIRDPLHMTQEEMHAELEEIDRVFRIAVETDPITHAALSNPMTELSRAAVLILWRDEQRRLFAELVRARSTDWHPIMLGTPGKDGGDADGHD